MVSALGRGPGATGPGSSLNQGRCVVFLGKNTLLSQCLSPARSINEYQQIVGETYKLRGGDLRWTSIPSKRSRNTPSPFMLQILG